MVQEDHKVMVQQILVLVDVEAVEDTLVVLLVDPLLRVLILVLLHC